MRTRTLVALGAAIVLAILLAALFAPRHQAAAGYVPARITAAPANLATEVTPMPYTLPTLVPDQVPCGQQTTVTYPDSTAEISFEGFVTTNGYIKVVAVLADQGRTFTTPHEGWQVAPIAPYRAEWLTPVTVTPCPEPVPEPPVIVTPAPDPVPPAPETPAEEPPHAHDCRD